MSDSTTQKVPQYKCGECNKIYKRKGSLTNHLKKIHNKNDSSATEEFLDATSYSEELDMEESVLRNIDREDVANNFFGDISDYESEDGNTIVTSSQQPESTIPSPSPLRLPPAPVPLCNTADSFIRNRGNTLPASLLATLLPAPSFLDDINKSLQENEQEEEQEQEQGQDQKRDDQLEEQANGLLDTFENEMRCNICHICGLTFSGSNKMKEHIA